MTYLAEVGRWLNMLIVCLHMTVLESRRIALPTGKEILHMKAFESDKQILESDVAQASAIWQAVRAINAKIVTR